MQSRSNSVDLSEVLLLFWRKRLWIAPCLVAGLLAAELAVRVIPPTYQAGTLIMVESQKVPADYIKATVTSNMEERLRTIEQQVTNRETLVRIVEELDLYPDLFPGGTVDEVVTRARRDLSVDVLGGTVFRIYYRGRSPEKAAAAANRIAELFIDENLALRQRVASSTTQFLERELTDTGRQLEEQERAVAGFRLRNEGRLPEQRESNKNALAQLQIRLGMVGTELDRLDIRRLYLQRGADSEGRVGTPSRLERLRLELAELESRYTDRHPDLARLRLEIARLEKQAEAATGESAERAAGKSADHLELDSVERETRRLLLERDRLLGEIAHHQKNVEAIPVVEQELLSLTRDYDNVQQSYQSLLRKQIEAQLAENLERQRQSEQFTILERAIAPTLPTAPKRWQLMLLGLIGGGLAGPGIVLLRHLTRQTFESVDDLRRAFPGVKVLAAIPRLGNPPRSRLREWLSARQARRAA